MHLCQILALEKPSPQLHWRTVQVNCKIRWLPQRPWLMEPRECFDDLLFRKLLLVTTLDKQSKTFQYNFDMMPDVYASLLTTRTLSFCPISLHLWFDVVWGLEVRSQFAPTPWWPCRPSTSRASEHSGSSDGCASKTFQKVPTQDNPRISAHTPSMFSISVQHFCKIYRTIKNPSGVCAWGSLTMIGRRVNFSKTWNKSGIVQVQVKSLNLTEANCELRQKSFFCRRWSW